VADVKGDGHLDLVAINGRVNVLLGQGDGSFGPAASYAGGPDATSVVAGDFTGQGRTDLAVANLNGDSVWILLNDGNWPAARGIAPQPSATPQGARVGATHTNAAAVPAMAALFPALSPFAPTPVFPRSLLRVDEAPIEQLVDLPLAADGAMDRRMAWTFAGLENLHGGVPDMCGAILRTEDDPLSTF
jgi:hypothetical protein